MLLVAAGKALGRSAFDGLGGILFRLLPWLILGGVGATLLSLILHPSMWLQIIAASSASLLALTICSVLAMRASEEENVSIFPVLPWGIASLSVILATVGALTADSTLMSIALFTALASIAVWIALIMVAGLIAWTTRSANTQT